MTSALEPLVMERSTDTIRRRASRPQKGLLDRATALVALVGSALTIGLTYANHVTKTHIDETELLLKERATRVDADLRDRGQALQEDKAKVERLRWVFDSLVPALTGQRTDKMTDEDVKRRTVAATAILRLALDQAQAQTLLAGLEQSTNPEVKKVAAQVRQEIVQIDRSEVETLVDQVVGADGDARRGALARLCKAFPNSTVAISRSLDRLQRPDRESLSDAGLVNLLYFLARTDPSVWTPELLEPASKAVDRLKASHRSGHQWKTELESVEAVMRRAGSA